MNKEEANKVIGVTKCDIKEGETVATMDVLSGEVTSNVIKFRPWGKRRVRNLIVYYEARLSG